MNIPTITTTKVLTDPLRDPWVLSLLLLTPTPIQLRVQPLKENIPNSSHPQSSPSYIPNGSLLMIVVVCSNNDVETECQVLITCTKYSDLRSDPFIVANDLIINFDDLDSECKFITIIESDETSLVQQLAKCIYHITKRSIQHVNADHVNLDDNNICSNT